MDSRGTPLRLKTIRPSKEFHVSEPTVYEYLEDAIREADNWDSPIHSIRHIIRRDNGWVIMGHINCEWCCRCGLGYPVGNCNHFIRVHDAHPDREDNTKV